MLSDSDIIETLTPNVLALYLKMSPRNKDLLIKQMREAKTSLINTEPSQISVSNLSTQSAFKSHDGERAQKRQALAIVTMNLHEDLSMSELAETSQPSLPERAKDGPAGRTYDTSESLSCAVTDDDGQSSFEGLTCESPAPSARDLEIKEEAISSPEPTKSESDGSIPATTKQEQLESDIKCASSVSQTQVLAPSSSGRTSSMNGFRIPKISTATNPSLKRKSFSGDSPLAASNSNNTSNAADPRRRDFPRPEWYNRVHLSSRPDSDFRAKKTRLTRIRDLIKQVAKAPANEREQLIESIRTELHVIEHYQVDAALVKESHVLDYDLSGLPRLTVPGPDGFEYPFDVVADAKALYHKWRREDFDSDILRGILIPATGRKSYSLAKDYKNRLSANFFGEGDLVVGQWWPIQLAALRDGAHGSAQGGVHWSRGQGAYSVLLGAGKPGDGERYEDRDDGETIGYTGTKGEGGNRTAATQSLHANIATGNPVRVLRSYNCPAENKYKPSHGLRYDGLYDVISYVELDAEKAHHRFLLRRTPNQAPIRWEGAYKRPSQEDLEAFNNYRVLMK